MTTIFYILIAFCLFFEVLNLAACKKVFAAVEKYKDKNDLTEISPVFAVWRMCNWIYLIRKSRLLYARRLFAGGKTYEAGRKAENNSNGSALDWHR